MISYFRIKENKGSHELRHRTKKKMFDKAKEKYISKKQWIFIHGAEGSGKSRHLEKLKEKADLVWKKLEIIHIKNTDSISEILHKALGEEAEKYLDIETDDGQEITLDTKKQYIQIEALVQKSKSSVVIIDNIDKFTGKKLEILKDILHNCKIAVYTASSEDMINRTIRKIIYKRVGKNINDISLKSTTSKDATNILFGMFIIALFIAGMPEVAMVVMGARMLSKGAK
jgi:hypothetical protein